MKLKSQNYDNYFKRFTNNTIETGSSYKNTKEIKDR